MKVPIGWTTTTLGELIPLTYGKALPEKQRTIGQVPVYGSSGVVGTHDEALTDGPTIIIGRKGNVGEPHLSSVGCWPIDTVYFFQSAVGADLRFYFHLLTHKELRQLDRSTAVPGLSRDDYNKVATLLPPAAEQQRIVEALDSYLSRLDSAVASLQKVQTKLKAYRASVLKAAVEGRLVPTEAEIARREGRDYEPASVLLARILKERRRRWEEAELARMKKAGKPPKDDAWKTKYQEPEAPDTSKLPPLPEGWCWATLGQAFTVTVGATPSRGVKEYWNGDIPWVSSGEVAFCRISGTRERITDAGLENSSTKLNPKGSVLVGMIGEGKTRGQAAILDIDACGNQNAAAIWVAETPIPSEFIYHYLVGQYEETRRRGSGNNQPALNKSRVEAIPVPIAPLIEQRRIVEQLDRAESVIARTAGDLDAGLFRVRRLRQSILKWAFEGKLVDQDPNDEPAEELLARIRAERAAAPTTKTRGRKAKSS